jgi:uncharacterized spore protein YtfJ
VDLQQMFAGVSDALTVRRVFGEPYAKNGVTVIPVADVRGGGGGGQGEEADHSGGMGGGFGLSARPAGAFVIKGDEVAWKPAVDVNRIVLGAQIVAVIALLTVRQIVKLRSKARVRN